MFFKEKTSNNLKQDMLKLNVALKLAESASGQYYTETLRFVRNGEIKNGLIPLICFGLSLNIPEAHLAKLVESKTIVVNGIEINDGILKATPVDNPLNALENSTSVWELLNNAKVKNSFLKECKKVLFPNTLNALSEAIRFELNNESEEITKSRDDDWEI